MPPGPDRPEERPPCQPPPSSGRQIPCPFRSISAPAIRLWARSRSGIVEKAVAKRLVGRPSLGGIAARPKFSGEVDANIDQTRSGRVELRIEMLEPAFHLAGLERRNLVLAQILGANGPSIAGGRLARVGWPGGFARGRMVFCSVSKAMTSRSRELQIIATRWPQVNRAIFYTKPR